MRLSGHARAKRARKFLPPPEHIFAHFLVSDNTIANTTIIPNYSMYCKSDFTICTQWKVFYFLYNSSKLKIEV